MAGSKPYRLSDVLGGLTDLISRRRSPSFSRKRDKEAERARKGSAPAGLDQMFVPVVEMLVASADAPRRASVSPMRHLDVMKAATASSSTPPSVHVQFHDDKDGSTAQTGANSGGF
ncbi:unnamed protein product [Nippostrongylus brasiliensis]|uniref:Uncharacterized protein n=1 Tax=Nippostrongylus brasiliensis TaxID=27835 RepID=A0A0N4YF42_NIPBR|nr:hypothetical protein Q1695_007524 [Nippostrongylus brasiliensis]VDL78951.1 unnamed protein product [Nippostrongylus brasiliensis]